MSTFVIQPHFRLHEWVAEEKGYFAAEGLDYEFREALDSKHASNHQLGDKVGAYQTFERGRDGNVQLRLPLDGQRRRRCRPRPAVRRRLFGQPVRDLRAARFADPRAQ